MSKYDVLKMMNEAIIAMGDDDIWYTWINVIPDGADDEDINEIAHDEELYNDACDLFADIIKTHIM